MPGRAASLNERRSWRGTREGDVTGEAQALVLRNKCALGEKLSARLGNVRRRAVRRACSDQRAGTQHVSVSDHMEVGFVRLAAGLRARGEFCTIGAMTGAASDSSVSLEEALGSSKNAKPSASSPEIMFPRNVPMLTVSACGSFDPVGVERLASCKRQRMSRHASQMLSSTPSSRFWRGVRSVGSASGAASRSGGTVWPEPAR